MAEIAFMCLGAIYVAGVALLTTPVGQRHAIYMHSVKWPLNPKFGSPHLHGLAPFKTLDFRLKTEDNLELGAWFILSESFYQTTYPRNGPPSAVEITETLGQHPTILFFHGNAASRAVNYRVQAYTQLTSRLKANVLAIDYRGFGDSEGSPSESGLGKDALAAWDWLIAHGALPSNITVMGHSLGTGVSAALAGQLAKKGVSPRALALIAPFSTVEKLLETYNFGGYLPVLRPFQSFPYVGNIILRFLQSRFLTVDIVQSITCPILLVHSTNDMTIPDTHSAEIFDKLIDPLLPAWPFSSDEMSGALKFTTDQLENIRQAGVVRADKRKEVVNQYEISGSTDEHDSSRQRPFGTISEFERGDGKGRVVWLETNFGGHTDIVRLEGTIDMVGRIAGLI